MLAACSVSDPALRQALADVDQRPSLARTKLRPYAEQGNEAAIARICVAYGTSIDSSVRGPERAQAFGWCEHAAKAGHVEAQYHLGMFYKSGIGITEDRGEALRWFQVAAGRGHAGAENEARGLEGKPSVCKNLITGCRMF
ncbi:MAG: sel1 repeat family protein [Burkholderiaceae bacterium]|nr:sel1 repeat family protein [Burkholderiaceae bacterium]